MEATRRLLHDPLQVRANGRAFPKTDRKKRISGSMKTQVEFRSTKFPPYAGEEEQTNPGLWGKRLAEYLSQRLVEMGIETAPVLAEDWGWYVPVRNDGCRLGICCGHQYGDDDQFICFTEPRTLFVRKIFKEIDVAAPLSRLTEAIAQILASDPEIRDVVWTEPD